MIKKQNYKGIKYMLKEIWDSDRLYLIISMTTCFTAFIEPILNILLLKIIVDSINDGEYLYSILLKLLVFITFFLIAIIYGFWYEKYYSPKSHLKITEKIQTNIFKIIKETDIKYFDSKEYYDHYNWVIKNWSSQPFVVLNTILRFITSLLSLFSIVAIVLVIDPMVLLISILGVIVSVVFSSIISSIDYAYDKDRSYINRYSEYAKRVFYLPEYAQELRISTIKNAIILLYHKTIARQFETIKKYDSKLFKVYSIQEVVQFIVTGSTIMYLAWAILSGHLTIGDFSALLMSSQQFKYQLTSLFNIIPEIKKCSLYSNDIINFINNESTIENSSHGISMNNEIIDIEFKNVSFRYPNSSHLVLKNINFKINKNEKIAIVGYNGAGKSTLIKLLLRLYDTIEGDIYINNRNIKDYNVHSLRENIGVVLQNYKIFSLTIAENVLGREIRNINNDEKIVIEALQKVGLWNYVKGLPMGIYTVVGTEFDNNGIQLSGGQLQKIALARMIVKNSGLLILDEPSSALDPIAEDELITTIMDLAYNKTLIIISHRLSTTKMCDRIFVMDNGEIVEEGTHEELMQQNGLYAKMFNVQSEKYYSSS